MWGWGPQQPNTKYVFSGLHTFFFFFLQKKSTVLLRLGHNGSSLYLIWTLINLFLPAVIMPWFVPSSHLFKLAASYLWTTCCTSLPPIFSSSPPQSSRARERNSLHCRGRNLSCPYVSHHVVVTMKLQHYIADTDIIPAGDRVNNVSTSKSTPTYTLESFFKSAGVSEIRIYDKRI